MKRLFLAFLAVLALASPARSQGSIPIALQTVISQNGQPIVGALLYFYQAGTVATRQDSFQDTALTQANQWPLPTDAFGRVPMFYLASGTIHVRLTDASGLQIFDYPNMLVIGPSGGGGGGATIDPTTIAATGDTKFRPSADVLTGWIRCNGNTIGSAVSGATERANADTQNLFVYLWNTFSGLPVSGGRGANALADFGANKTISTIDMRGFAPHGLDTMGAAAANRLVGALFGGGNSSTPASTGGEATHSILLAQLPATPAPVSVTVTPTVNAGQPALAVQSGVGSIAETSSGVQQVYPTTSFSALDTKTITNNTANLGSGTAMNVMNPFILGTFFMKL